MGAYVQDQWKPVPSLVLTAGIRFEHNSNPVCHTNCFASLSNNFAALSTSPTTPYSNANGGGLINGGQGKSFTNFQKIGYEPRFGFAFTPPNLGNKTVIRGGFGIFADAFPAQITDNLLNNAPTNVGFTLFGPAFGGTPNPLYAGAAGSFSASASASNTAFQQAFRSGGSFSTLSNSVLNFAPPNFVSPVKNISYPTYEEYSLTVEQQIGRTTTFTIDYVGNHTYHQPVLNNSINAYNSGGTPGFASLSQLAAPNGSFAQVTQIYTGANSNYNGVVLSATKRASYLSLQFNYAYSHALDEISNGGFNAFSSNSVNPTNPNPAFLRQNYGNADYDVRHYVSANYVLTVPYIGGPRILTKGYEIAGTLFHSTGLPFTYTDGKTALNLTNYGGALYAQQTVAHLPTHCFGIQQIGAAVQANQCVSAQDFVPATDFGQQERNQSFGPGFTDTDLSVYKSIDVPHYEHAHLKLGVQFFNLLNHPNFAQPGHDLAPCYTTNPTTQVTTFTGCAGTTVGTINATVNPPTSILGSFLGGDASPRLIQIKANLNF